ncbi:S-layer homology domain-containing protein, partial [Evtepia sp.]|uniref:S-layer homology domain-containing protein n=1 Tax=Evtepia sp. TaxID=2773933 RepID=UPI003F14A3A7
MVVGAGAAFKDQSKIVNAEAVDACSALNIINGYPDGSYKPEGTITRAEACKMICVALNGGKEPTLGTSATASFTDTKGHWAEGYIESCVAQGIVAGIGGGKFNPNGNVTGSQFAKMLLIALGYNADTQGYTGAPWEVNVNVDASAKGLYADLAGMDPAKALSRDNAAQMVWNALNAYEVEYKYNLVSENGQLVSKLVLQDKVVGKTDDKITLLEDKYEAKAITGTLSDVTQDNGKDTYSITIEDPQYKGEEYNDGNDVTYTDVAKDYSSLKYQNVRVLVKPDKNGKDAVVYGVYATNKNTVQTGLLADLKMDGAKAKLDGTKYSLAKKDGAEATTVYVDGQKVYDGQSPMTISKWLATNAEGKAADAANHADKGSTVKLLAIDGTTNYSILEVTTYAVKKVTYVGSDYVTAGTKYTDDDYVLDSNLKKDDYAVISSAGNYANDKGRLDKATVVEGKITSTKVNSAGNINKVAIDGTWYETSTVMTGNSALRMSASVKLVLVNGYIYDIGTITAGTTDIALIVELGKSNSIGSKYYQARLILADGTDKVVDVEKKDGNDVALDENDFSKYNNMLCTYDVSKDVYTLTVINGQTAQGDMAGYQNFYYTNNATIDGSIRSSKAFSGNANNVNKTDVTRAYFYDTATVFVKYKNDDYKVVSGKTVQGWKETTVSTKVRLLTEADKNAQYVGAAFIDLGSDNTPGGSDKTYAVALESSYLDKVGGTTYTMVKAWNGTEEVVYKYEGTKTIAAGTIFEYSADGEDTVDITVCAGTDAMVKTYDVGSGEITFDGSITNLTDANSKIDAKDTVVLYVDSANGKGEKDGEIQLAPKFDGDSGNTDKNVTVYVEAGEKDNITVIVVDVQNKLDW